ncbi:MAG: hypothetical protein IID57_11685 [Proteobacteria bacterium]|nr:hypothetical protein [Pseudomonadota bacterium]
MNMHKLIMAMTLALTLVVSMPAMAQTQIVINAIETSPANIILPANTSGMMTFRPCAEECEKDYKRVQLSAATTFSVNGKAVKFDEFRRNFAIIKRAATSYALVTYEVDTNRLISIRLAG